MSDAKQVPEKIKDKDQAITWNPYLAVVAVVVIFFAAQFIGEIIVSIYPSLHHWSTVQANDWLNSSVIAQFVYVVVAEGLTLLFIWLFLRQYKVGLKAIGLLKPKWVDIAYALSGLAVYYLSYIVLLSIVTGLIPSLNIDQKQQIGFTDVAGVGQLVVTFISLVLLPPFVEEIMFRGFLYTSLRKHIPKIVAALVTSIIFASAHLEIGQGAPLLWVASIDTFVLSLVLIYLRQKTGRLYASMGVHGLKNGIAFVTLFILHAH